MRRTEWLLFGALVAAVVVAAVAGLQVAPDEALRDPRRSVSLHGPRGSSALNEVLRRMDVPVREWNTAFFDLDEDLRPRDAWLALLDLAYFPSRPELDQLVRHVTRGGRLLVVGESGAEHCFGYEVVSLPEADFGRKAPILPPEDLDVLPGAASVLRRVERTTDEVLEIFGERPDCSAPAARDTAALLRTNTGRFVAVRLAYDGGGVVILVSEGELVSNEALRDTDAGPVIVQWLLADGVRPVVFDEYHQGFGQGGSLFAAAWRWVKAAPAGWTLLQAAVAGLLALVVLALRFGPARHVVERERRSSIEHVEALAVGLERAGAATTAVELLLAGLKRRLRGGAAGRRQPPAQWLAALELAARSPDARERVRRLAQLMHEPRGSERVLEAATAVEDVWTSLGHGNGSKGSSPR